MKQIKTKYKESYLNQLDNFKIKQEQRIIFRIGKWAINTQEIIMNIGLGKEILKMNEVINFQKGSYLIVILSMMCYFDNFSTGCYFYLLMHGAYGCFWVMKDKLFPDHSFQKRVSLLGALIITIFWPLLGYGGYLLCSRKVTESSQNPSIETLIFCQTLFIVGLVMMLGSDAQKYFILQNQKMLITNGYMKWTRNPNYIGEILIYCSFATLINSQTYWIILISKWVVVFSLRIAMKEYSLSQKQGFEVYSQNSWLILPKFFGNTIISMMIYSIIFFLVYIVCKNNGFYQTLKIYGLVRKR